MSLLCIFGCSTTSDTISAKFSTLKNTDYSKLENISITYRRNSYFIKYKDVDYIIKKSSLTSKIRSIKKRNYDKNKNISLSKEDISHIEYAITMLDSLNLQNISIDKNRNISLSFLWGRKCTYYFLNLSSKSTLEEIKKVHYNKYEDEWYYQKVCAE